MFPSYLEVEKNGFQLFRSRQRLLEGIWREKKGDPCYLETKKCSSRLLGARKKIMTSISSQKNWFSSNQEYGKKFFPAIWNWKKLVPSYFEPDKHCWSYLEREKSGSLLFGD